MIKIILGSQSTPNSMIRQIDMSLVTSDSESDAIVSLVRLLQNNSSSLPDPLMASHLTTGDFGTMTDLASLKMYLQDGRLGLVISDIIQEVGDEENSSLSIVVVNKNSKSLIKPGIIYHTTPVNINMLDIYEDIIERFNLLPRSIYGDSLLIRTLDGAKEMKKLTGAADNLSLANLNTMFTNLGFDISVIAR